MREAIASGNELLTMLVDDKEVKVRLEISERHREILLAGGLLNWARTGA
jgi:aconitate hydratase